MYEPRKSSQITGNQCLIDLSLLKKIFCLTYGFIYPIVEERTKLSRLK